MINPTIHHDGNNGAEPIDPDIEFVLDYLTGELSPEREAEFEARFLDDEAFFDKIAPFWKDWHNPVSDRALMEEYHPETELPPKRAPRARRTAAPAEAPAKPAVIVVAQPTLAELLRRVPPRAPRTARSYLPLSDFLYPLTTFRIVRYAVAAAVLPFWFYFAMTRIVVPLGERIAANQKAVEELERTRTRRQDIRVSPIPPTVALPAPSRTPDPATVAPPVKPAPAVTAKPESLKAIKSIVRTPPKTVAPAFADSEYQEVTLGGVATALVKQGSHFTYQATSSSDRFTMMKATLVGEAVFLLPTEGHPYIALQTPMGGIMFSYGGRYAVRCVPDSGECLLTVAEGDATPTGARQVKAGQFARIAKDGTVTLTDGAGFPVVPPPPKDPEVPR